jgi:tRNA A37 threonylcarbamoyladenosine biosynthesis protein TsaE
MNKLYTVLQIELFKSLLSIDLYNVMHINKSYYNVVTMYLNQNPNLQKEMCIYDLYYLKTYQSKYNVSLNDVIYGSNLSCIEFMVEKLSFKYDNLSIGYAILANKTNVVDIIQYMKSTNCPWDSQTFLCAALIGNMDVINYLIGGYFPVIGFKKQPNSTICNLVYASEPEACPYDNGDLFAMALRGAKYIPNPLNYIYKIYNLIKSNLYLNVDANNIDYYGYSFINVGVFSENLKIMDFLLSENNTTYKYSHCLINAIITNNKNMVEWVLVHENDINNNVFIDGASYKLQNSQIATQLALKFNNKSIIQLLKEYNWWNTNKDYLPIRILDDTYYRHVTKFNQYLIPQITDIDYLNRKAKLITCLDNTYIKI